MRGFKNFKGSDARCPSIHFLFYVYVVSNHLLLKEVKAGERGGGQGGQNTWGPDWLGGPKSW